MGLALIQPDVPSEVRATDKVRQAHLDARIASLRELRVVVETCGSSDEREPFTMAFRQARLVLEIDDSQLARDLKTARPTIGRWARGDSAPHPLGRGPVYAYLLRQIDERLRRYAAR